MPTLTLQPVLRPTIITTAQSLPAAPQALAGLCELLQDCDASLDEISNKIRIDAALATRVIRISNSAVFGAGLRIGSVDEAVNRVGFGEILRLVGVATVAGLIERALPCYNLTAVQMRESVLLHALATEALASRMGIDERTAYSGGLLRALGIVVLDRIGRQRQPATASFTQPAFANYTSWERASFGISNLEVATIVLEEWRFPADLVAGIREHLLTTESGYRNRFACMLNLAGGIVAQAGHALPGDVGSWTLTPQKLAAAKLDEEQWRAAGERALELFEQQRTSLG